MHDKLHVGQAYMTQIQMFSKKEHKAFICYLRKIFLDDEFKSSMVVQEEKGIDCILASWDSSGLQKWIFKILEDYEFTH